MSQGARVPLGLVPSTEVKANREPAKKAPRWLAIGLWSFFTAIWIALGMVLIVAPEAVTELWTWIGEQSTPLQIAIWIGFLPVMVAIGVWETSWALWVRLGVLALCVIWTTVGFYPKRISE